MNRINPLYIVVLLVLILLFSMFKLNNAKDDLKEVKKSYEIVNNLSTKLKDLKGAYSDKKKIEKSLKNILSNKILKNSSLEYTFKKSSLKIYTKKMDINSLNFLMSKILNNNYNINILQIKSLSDTKASLKMEIKW